MANGTIDTFLQAEENAHRLVEELTRLKSEADSYKGARKALDQAADGVSTLVGSLGDIAGRLGVVVETLGSIGTPELLRGHEAIIGELTALRQNVSATQQSIMEAVTQNASRLSALHEALDRTQQLHQEQLTQIEQQIRALATADSLSSFRREFEQQYTAHREEVKVVREELGARVAGSTAAITAVRKLAIGSIGLSLVTLVILGWVALTLVRG